jgi:hypothetical protein
MRDRTTRIGALVLQPRLAHAMRTTARREALNVGAASMTTRFHQFPTVCPDEADNANVVGGSTATMI